VLLCRDSARELDRREAGEPAELVDEMRLVVVAAGFREFDPRHLSVRAIQDLQRAAKAMHARQRIRERDDAIGQAVHAFAEPRKRAARGERHA